MYENDREGMMDKIILMPHQIEVLDNLKDFKTCAIYTDMGSGKTFMASEKIHQLYKMFPDKRIIVLCKKSARIDWIDHFEKYYPNLSVAVVNYDLLVARKLHEDVVGKYLLIIDESSAIKNPSALRTKYTMTLSTKADGVVLLSGTPIGGKYEQLLTQCHILGWKIDPKTFDNNYIISKWVETESYKDDGTPYMEKVIVGYKNIDHLKNRLKAHGAYFGELRDGIKMPDTIKYFEQDKRYKELFYHNMYEDMVNETPPMRHNNLLLACGLNQNKLDYVEELLENTNERVIIFYNRRRTFDKLKEIVLRLKKPLSYVNGDGRDLENYEQKEDTVTLCHFQSGAYSLNLQRSAILIYVECTPSPELLAQSKKRVDRIGQTKPLRYYYLIVRDSREESCWENVNKGVEFTNKLFEKEDVLSLTK